MRTYNKLATIQRIHSLRPHPDAEVTRIELAKVKEWPVVVPKGQFSEGELVVFIVIDSIVPSTHPDFAFMEKMKYRVLSCAFKKAPSQGLVVKLSVLPPDSSFKIEEGADCTELLGVVKHEKPEPIGADIIGEFPSDIIPITDELNFLNYPEVLSEFLGKQVYITEKADGSSCTVISGEQFMVCSRTKVQKEDTGFWKVIKSHDLHNKMRALPDPFALQGEVVGPGVNGNRMRLTNHDFRLFNARNLATGKYLAMGELWELANKLNIHTVKFIDTFVFDDTWNLDRLRAMADNVKYGNEPGEGIVIRPVIPEYSPVLGRQLSVKIINSNYKD